MRGTIWWDFDGTLVSRPRMWSGIGYRLITTHRPDINVSLEAVGEALRVGFPWHDHERDHLDLCDSELWWAAVCDRYVTLFADLGWPDADRKALLPVIREHILDCRAYTVFDDVVPVLNRLRSDGWRHLVVSNHIPELPALVDGLGLGGSFEAVVTSALAGYEKPHGQLFAAARAQTTGDGPIWMVGDNPHADCFGATRYGVRAVLVRTAEGFEPRCADLWGVCELLMQC